MCAGPSACATHRAWCRWSSRTARCRRRRCARGRTARARPAPSPPARPRAGPRPMRRAGRGAAAPSSSPPPPPARRRRRGSPPPPVVPSLAVLALDRRPRRPEALGTVAAVGDEHRHRVAVACRILAAAGLIEDVLGHVSVRADDDTVLVRGRGRQEAGVLYTVPADVVSCSLRDGSLLEDADRAVPTELPIHLACYRADAAVGAVVHAHPPAGIAADGIPVFPRAVLINTDALAAEMRVAMGDRPVCVLRGHGITTTGATLEQAVARALAVDSLARMACRVVSAGGTPTAIAEADLAQLPDLGAGFNDEMLWRHHERRLAEAGHALTGAET